MIVSVKKIENHIDLFFFINNLLSNMKYIVATRNAIKDISENNGIPSPPKNTLNDKHRINVAIEAENLLVNEDIILKVKKVVSVLKNKCIKRTDSNKLPDVIIRKGTKNT